MNRVKRVAYQILELHRDSFTDDFEKNKEVLDKVAQVRSKQLRNEIAGFITKLMKEEAPEEKTEKLEATLAEAARA
ncbi:MAG: 30S ribosomal protein S17e [Nitrososphaerales archaeon]